MKATVVFRPWTMFSQYEHIMSFKFYIDIKLE